MYDCSLLFVPSNLGETKLTISIDPSFDKLALDISGIQELHHGLDETYNFEGFSCLVMADTARTAQQTVCRLSKQLEKRSVHSIQSDRLYFLPLFTSVRYSLTVDHQKRNKNPVIRIAYCPDNPMLAWQCKIYVSNLVQLQEALFSHERNLLRKQLQVLNQQRTKTWESEST